VAWRGAGDAAMIPLEQMTDEEFERTLWTFSIANWACTVLRAFCASTERARATPRATAISGSRGLRWRSWLRNSKAARSRSTSDCSLLCRRKSAAATGQLGYFPSVPFLIVPFLIRPLFRMAMWPALITSATANSTNRTIQSESQGTPKTGRKVKSCVSARKHS
jgi:hypothetical protein